MEQLLTKKDVMERFKVSEMTVNNWMKDGTLPYVKISRTVRFKPSDIQKLINSKQV